ncbi:unnamed protein product [Linum trigynum]|uniref:Uncharacterized protein n=1 Tax=Linum trigynum TaxID=586398 RepID=A0AAV2CJX3_9ROSI
MPKDQLEASNASNVWTRSQGKLVAQQEDYGSGDREYFFEECEEKPTGKGIDSDSDDDVDEHIIAEIPPMDKFLRVNLFSNEKTCVEAN